MIEMIKHIKPNIMGLGDFKEHIENKEILKVIFSSDKQAWGCPEYLIEYPLQYNLQFDDIHVICTPQSEYLCLGRTQEENNSTMYIQHIKHVCIEKGNAPNAEIIHLPCHKIDGGLAHYILMTTYK